MIVFSQPQIYHYIIFLNQNYIVLETFQPMQQQNLIDQPFQNKFNMAFAMISPGNSYYNKLNIENAISIASHYYRNFRLFIPEVLSLHNYRALGYTPQEALKATTKRCKILKKHCSQFPQNIFRQSQFYEREDFQIELDKIVKLYNQCGEFKNDVDELTRGALESKINSSQNDDQIVDLFEGCFYMLKELAILMTISANEEVTVLYNQNWKVYQKFIAGAYDKQPKQKLSFALYSHHQLP